MAQQNRWQVGVMYNQGLLNGVPFFTQPDGPGTAVFPTQQNGPWADYPIPGLVINEYSPWFAPGCGHAIKMWRIFQEVDYTTDTPVSLICCVICSYCQRVESLVGGAAADFDTQTVYNPYSQLVIL